MLLVFHHALSAMDAPSRYKPIASLVEVLKNDDNQAFCKLLNNEATTYEQVEQCINTTRPNINCYTNDDEQMTPLHILMKRQSAITLACVELLCSLDANPNAPILAQERKDWTPLHCAVENMLDLGVLEGLIEMGANPNQQNAIGDTPLHLLLKRTHPEDFEDLDEEDEGDQNPIESAKFVTYKLLSHHTKLSIQNQAGDTPLHLAAAAHYNDQKNCLRVCAPLTTQEIINLPNKAGLTPLAIWCKSFAASNSEGDSLGTINQQCDCVRPATFFISKDANINIIDKQDRRPIEYLLQVPRNIPKFEAILSLLVPDDIYKPFEVGGAEGLKEKITLYDLAKRFSKRVGWKEITLNGRFGWKDLVIRRHKANTNRLVNFLPSYVQCRKDLGFALADDAMRKCDNTASYNKTIITKWNIVKQHPSFASSLQSLLDNEQSGGSGKKRTLEIDDQSLSQKKHQRLARPKKL